MRLMECQSGIQLFATNSSVVSTLEAWHQLVAALLVLVKLLKSFRAFTSNYTFPLLPNCI